MPLEPTYKVYEIVDRIDLFDSYELGILKDVINEEKKRYSKYEFTVIHGLIANRYGQILIEKNKK
jgi:hypothetical protein